MPIPVHTVEVPDGLALQNSDRLVLGTLNGVANAAGGGAGQSVATAITGMSLPPKYQVIVDPGQDATCWITAMTAAGFTVNMSPRLAANTLAAGSFNATVVA
jgi:hypothetical protein